MVQKRSKVTKAGVEGEFSVGVDLAFGWLRKFHVFLASHESPQLQQHHLDAVGVLPLGECSYSVHVNLGRQTTGQLLINEYILNPNMFLSSFILKIYALLLKVRNMKSSYACFSCSYF